MKIFNDDEIFESQGQEIKIGYLNINGILETGHSEYLNNDKNLLKLDILAIAETKLTKNVNDSQLEELLTEYNILRRFDIDDGMKHMGFLIMTPRNSKKVVSRNIIHFKDDKSQVIILDFGDPINKRFGFIYLRPSSGSQDQISKMLKKYQCNTCDVLMGDLNLNPRISYDSDRLKQLCGSNKEIALHEVTTSQKNQLDHILVARNLKGNIYVTSYVNFISDHKSIVLRLGLQKNELKDEIVQSLNHSSQRYMKRSVDDTGSPKVVENMQKKSKKVEEKDEQLDIFQSIQEENWLRDDVINTYSSLIQECFNDIFVFSTFFYNTLKNDPQRAKRQTRNTNIFSKRYVYFPIHEVNHWYLIMIDNINNHIESLDPYQYNNNAKAKKNARLIQNKKKRDIEKFLVSLEDYPAEKKYSMLTNNNIPKQTNGHDCGVYMLMFMKYTASEKEFDFTQKDMLSIRKSIEEELKNNALNLLESSRRITSEEIGVTQEGSMSKEVRKLIPPRFSNSCMTMCWLNSMLQVIIKTIEFTGVESSLKDLLIQYKNSGQINSAKQIRIKLSEKVQELRTGQQDPFQFFQAISLFEDYERLSLTGALILQWLSRTECLINSMHTYEHENDIDYCIEINVPEKSNELCIAIENGLVDPQVISDWKCDICQVYGGLKYKFLTDLNMPKFLIIKLRRGKRDENGCLYKDERPVDAAQTITVTSKEGNEYEFTLCGIITHYGSSIESGHYIAEIKQQQKWFKCNDSIITETISENLSTTGYEFLYKKS